MMFLVLVRIGDKIMFQDWIKKNRNYDISVDEFINNKIDGVTHLYNDDKYLLTRVNTFTSIKLGATSTELCLAFPNDVSVGFENPIDEFLENFFIYGIQIIENCDKMYQTELLGITVFKNKKKYHSDVRYWPPRQGPGGDLYYTDLKKCVLEEQMSDDFLNISKEVWDIFYKDVEQQRKLEKK